jgi:hypothetical protein
MQVAVFLLRPLIGQNLLSFTPEARKSYKQDQRVLLGIIAREWCSATDAHHDSLRLLLYFLNLANKQRAINQS